MMKTGAANREELVAMLPRANPDARSSRDIIKLIG